MKAISERFERKIPTFLAHLDVWNDTPMSDCKYTTHNYKREMHKQNYTKKCVICGKHSLARITTNANYVAVERVAID